MPITPRWYNDDKRVILIDVVGKWTWEDYQELGNQIRPMLLSVDHTVDLIADMRQSGPIPRGLASVHIRRGQAVRPDNYGITINVGADSFAKALTSAIHKAYGGESNQIWVETLDDALDYIQSYRQDTPDDTSTASA